MMSSIEFLNWKFWRIKRQKGHEFESRYMDIYSYIDVKNYLLFENDRN